MACFNQYQILHKIELKRDVSLGFIQTSHESSENQYFFSVCFQKITCTRTNFNPRRTDKIFVHNKPRTKFSK